MTSPIYKNHICCFCTIYGPKEIINDSDKCSFFYNFSIIKCKINLQKIRLYGITYQGLNFKDIILIMHSNTCNNILIKKKHMQQHWSRKLLIISLKLIRKVSWELISLALLIKFDSFYEPVMCQSMC